jgi:hypothetical protein
MKVLDPLNEESEHTTLYSIGMQPYLYGLLTDSFTPTEILQKLPAKVKRNSRCSFQNEIYLARFRMKKIPTRWWAATFRLCDTPLCRHCESCIEEDSHLFFNCPSLNYSAFIPFTLSNLDELSISLTNPGYTRSLEDAVLRFVYFNNLFQVENTLQDNNTIPSPTRVSKRKIDISPSPSKTGKRRREIPSNARKRSRSETQDPSFNAHQSPKRRFMGPGSFVQAMITQTGD